MIWLCNFLEFKSVFYECLQCNTPGPTAKVPEESCKFRKRESRETLFPNWLPAVKFTKEHCAPLHKRLMTFLFKFTILRRHGSLVLFQRLPLCFTFACPFFFSFFFVRLILSRLLSTLMVLLHVLPFISPSKYRITLLFFFVCCWKWSCVHTSVNLGKISVKWPLDNNVRCHY